MRNIKKITFGLILVGSTAMAAPLSNTLFNIIPSQTNINLSSNGSGSVIYTVTNNATTSATPSITPGYQSSGNNLIIGSNTCNVSLSPGASCTFRVLISGSNQPGNFTITPRVCGFNGFMCSIPRSVVTVTVTRLAPGLVTRAYEEVVDNNTSTTTLIGININNTSDVISSVLDFTNSVNSVVISPDGSKVYASQHDSGGSSVAFFDVTSSQLILNKVVILPDISLRSAPATNLQMAITPDGSTLFITRSSGSPLLPFKNSFIAPTSLFRIDLTSQANNAIVITDPDGVLVNPRGLVVSPDSKTVYIGTSANYILALPANALIVRSSNKVAEGRLPDDDHPGLAIDSAGNKLYVGNESEGSVSILTVNGTQAHFENTILNSVGFNGATGLAVSPDGTTLYVAESGNNSVLAVPLNNPDLFLLQGGINGAFGLGLSLNGSTLYVTQIEDGIDTTTVINTANFLASPLTIFIGGVSLTIGQFMGP
jgi:DNA-binding beta-propeller fold protein YncE